MLNKLFIYYDIKLILFIINYITCLWNEKDKINFVIFYKIVKLIIIKITAPNTKIVIMMRKVF